MVRPEVAARVRDLTVALPEATVRTHHDGRQFSEVRGRWFCILSEHGLSTDMIVDIDPGERDALVSTGHPFFAGGLNANRIGVVIDERTDWTEIRELITDSFRISRPDHFPRTFPTEATPRCTAAIRVDGSLNDCVRIGDPPSDLGWHRPRTRAVSRPSMPHKPGSRARSV